MIAPTFTFRLSGAPRDLYRRSVARLADEVVAAGDALRPIVDAYGAWIEETGRERRRTDPEYLVEALTLGVLWRARGADATPRRSIGRAFVAWLATWRRGGGARPRDGSPRSVEAPFERSGPCPTLRDLDALLTGLLASGEDAETVTRLEGWEEFLRADPASAGETLEELVAFADAFDGWSARALGMFTEGAERISRQHDLPGRRRREDALPCAPRRIEYHLAMLGAELRDRAWRAAMLDCDRHVAVRPGASRPRLVDAPLPVVDAAAFVPRAA